MKRKVFYLALVIGLILAGCSSVTPGDYREAKEEYVKLEKRYSDLLEDEIKPREVNSLEKRYSDLLEIINEGIKTTSSKELKELRDKILKRLNILEDLKD